MSTNEPHNLQTMLAFILDHAVGEPYFANEQARLEARRDLSDFNLARPFGTPPKDQPDAPGGWNEYTITVPNYTFDLVARKVSGKWEIKSYRKFTSLEELLLQNPEPITALNDQEN